MVDIQPDAATNMPLEIRKRNVSFQNGKALMSGGGFLISFRALLQPVIDGDVKHVMLKLVKTITIRDLRQRWPEAEAALNMEDEILITRDSKPVAKLVRVSTADGKRPRWDLEQHARWQKKVSGGKVSRSDAALAQSRAERVFSSEHK